MASKPRETSMLVSSEALPGRPQPLVVPEKHFVNGNRLAPPFPAGLELGLFAMGCFWGAAYLQRVRNFATVPVCAGFGIRSADQVAALSGQVDGCIVGSALVEILDAGKDVTEFLLALRA